MLIDNEALNDPDALYLTTSRDGAIGLVAPHNLPQFLRDYWTNNGTCVVIEVSKVWETFESWHAFHEEDPF